MSKLPAAFFVEHPRRIDDLRRPFPLESSKPYIIEKTITLAEIDYENFITDLYADRWFVDKYTDKCRVDENGVWHCILVKQKIKADGILVMSDGHVFPKWSAYLSNTEVIK